MSIKHLSDVLRGEGIPSHSYGYNWPFSPPHHRHLPLSEAFHSSPVMIFFPINLLVLGDPCLLRMLRSSALLGLSAVVPDWPHNDLSSQIIATNSSPTCVLSMPWAQASDSSPHPRELCHHSYPQTPHSDASWRASDPYTWCLFKGF